jgi:sugar/nucleoside kinase (ribokinase family)
MKKSMQTPLTKIRIATIGYLISDWLVAVEHFPVLPGDHQTLGEIAVEPGGMCNFLIAGQRLGGQMTALDAIGADRYGLDLLDTLDKEGVDTRGVMRMAGARSRGVMVMSSPEDEHVFLAYPGSVMPEQSFNLDWQRVLAESEALYLDGFSLRQEHVRSAALAAAQWMAGQGKKVFFDPGPAADLGARVILPRLDGLFLTAGEISRWTERGVEELFGGSQNLAFVAVKEGAGGCTIYTKDEPALYCRGFSVPVRDTLGAGDVFNAAFILSLLQGKSLAECADFANAAGAVQVQKFGAGRNVPTREEVEEMIGKQLKS